MSSTPIEEVPWLIEGGAVASVQVARNVSYMAAGGTGGITRGADLEVRELAVPGSSVRVFPGTAAVPNRAAGAKDEMYVARIGQQETVQIAATGASARHDMIVLRVENPWAAGETWPEPSDPAVGPYASLAVISGVGANANDVSDLGLSADHSLIPLARVDIPASTGTITQSMITDLRKMNGAVSTRESTIIAPSGTNTLNSSSFVNWPADADVFFDVPEWATHVRTKVLLAGIKHEAGNVVGQFRVKISDTGTVTQVTGYNVDSDNRDRSVLMAGSPMTRLPREDRGKPGIRFRLEGKKQGGTTALVCDNKSMISIDVEFVNQPESNV